MNEGFLTNAENEPTRKEQIIALALELHEQDETFLFSGIEPEAYAKMKAVDDEFPGYTTPIDDIVERLKNEGMRVVLGKNPESGNVFVLPSQSTNIEMDSISPSQLQLSDGMNEKLKKLIALIRG